MARNLPPIKTGHQALVEMLAGKKWGAKTLRQASIDYTPDNPKHIDTIVGETGSDLWISKKEAIFLASIPK